MLNALSKITQNYHHRARDSAGIRETRPMRFDLAVTIDARDPLEAAQVYDDVARRLSVAIVMVFRRLTDRGRLAGLTLAQDGCAFPVDETVAQIRLMEPVTH